MSEPVYDGIAIVGMDGRFPGAENVGQLWENLVAGKESISFFSDADLVSAGFDPAALRAKGHYVAARGVLKDADCFDAAFFGVHPKEAEAMDPQHRVFLETCWTALERAGYAPDQAPGSVGVFAGATFNTFYEQVLQRRPDLLELVGADQVMLGNEKDYLCTRVAYKLGLRGPALNISTACSTSLVAVAQACQALLTYQCDMALAGGVSVRVPQQRGYYHDEGNIGSADGHTRTFDAQASGTAFSNGVAVVVLKRLEDAVNDGDRVYAIIKGTALNNDGSQRVSFGAPGVDGQSRVIALAHALADVNPETITCVEAHGTATPLGDPIEVAGLTKAFRMGTDAKGFCALGSLKSNVGHLDAAAGVAGLIKMTLSLHHKAIPASLHFQAPNPKLDLENSPFYINAQLQQWTPPAGVPRRGGVSSFGTGGTNAHVVVEEAPEIEPSGDSRDSQLLMLSAKTPEALERATANLRTYLQQRAAQPEGHRQREFADAAFTLQTGRSEFVHRRIVACEDPAEGAAALEALDPKRIFTNQQKLKDPPVVFLFPGQGAQYAGMGAELYRSEPVFRQHVDRCAAILQPLIGTDIRTVLFPAVEAREEANQLLVQTRFTQPALFTIEYSLAQLWMSWGIKPAAMIGHSVGEYVTGCLSGVFTLEDALSLVSRRAALVQTQPGGAMLAVRLPESEVLPLLNPAMAIAAINSPALCVVAGPYPDIASLETELQAREVVVRRLNTSHAFHSPMMEPVLEPFTELLRTVKLGEPQIPFVSNVTARWITAEEARSPEYWAGHVRQAVRFSDGVAELVTDPRRVLLEVGPGHTLTTLARQHPARPAEQVVLASMPQVGSSEQRGLVEALGRLWLAGVTVDWAGFHAGERRRRTVLPAYPFERKRYWPEAAKAVAAAASAAPAIASQPAAPPAPIAAPAPQLPEPPQAAPSPAVPRKERLLGDVRKLVEDLSGYDLSGVDPTADLLEFGLDSLLLTQASQLLQRKFSVAVSFRQLMEELSSLEAIASYLDTKLPPEAFAAPAPVPQTAAVAPSAQPAIGNSAVLEQLLAQQQQLMNQLLGLLGREPQTALPLPAAKPAAPAIVISAPAENKSHGPFKPIQRGDTSISATQRAALDALIARYTRRTAGSKKLAAANRRILADPRSVSGFKQLWKEMVYPIYTTRSDGSHVWDVDGNEYVDFMMGFGASLFGHRPPFVVQAVHEQLDRGFEIGPIQPLAGEVAELFREFTGMQRVGFTNTGSEAVLAATRISRTATGRDKIAVFAGAYHGIFDEVLFRPLTINGETRTAPIAPGIPGSALEQVVVLDWANPQSLDILRARGSEIAAVLVEPVQSRRLDVQPAEFLRGLRQVTQEIGAALIFDEVVTGFRLHPGGAQAHFGIRADLATYGKVMGGGVSIGVVAGDPKYMDVLDGGQWQYGDTSFPEVGVTFFAGTFVRHPLALAAAKAVLLHLKEAGPALQRDLNESTARIAQRLREAIAEFGAPYEVTQFSSLIQVGFPADQKLAGLFFYLLRDRGIHIYENRAFVMTTSHTDEDLDLLVKAFRECLAEIQRGEFVATRPGAKAPVAALAPAPSPTQVSSFPLTEAQKEIWLAAQMGGDAAVAYNESLKLDFHGLFDPELFRTAVRTVVQRHPILLARISEDGQTQHVDPGIRIETPLLGLTVLEEPERQRRLEAVLESEVSAPFDVSTGPLVRVKIVRLSYEHHLVIWTAHHIVCDGWSGGVVVAELGTIYSALKRGLDPVLEPPESFQEYALAGSAEIADAKEALDYWRQQFMELPPLLDFPADHARPAVRSAKAATVKRSMKVSLLGTLKRAAGQQRTTLVVLLLAGLESLFHRLTGQAEFVVGLAVAGQAVTGKGCLVGHCVNLLPIRTRLQPEASFQENLTAVKKSVLDAYDHNQTTIGRILQELTVPRSADRPPLVEVIFNVDRDVSSAEFDGLEFSCERNPKRALHYDFFFNFVEGARGLYLECDYNTDLFTAATIERWLGHYESLLEAIAARPAESPAKLPILSEAERQDLVVARNNTVVAFPAGCTFPQLFERQASSTPERCAVTFREASWSYAELDRRSNQLAHHLKSSGVGRDVLVGVCAERSLDMLVALVAILKAGGAYVPLDPSFPPDRLAYMVQDSGMRHVVTHRGLEQGWPFLPETIIRLDAGWDQIATRSNGRDRLPGPAPQDLAYALYTSGSTGKPKGVEIPHSALANLLLSMQREPGFSPADTLLAVTTISFDIAGLELYLPLIAGGQVAIASREDAQDPMRLLERMRDSGCTVMQATPATWRALLHAGWKGDPNLKLLCGGESLPRDLAMELLPRCAKLWNMYGPTETTIWSTVHRIGSAGNAIPIGRPIANTQVFVLDANRNLTLPGAIGELCIGGAGLARGYLGNEALTKERFIQSPFDPAERLYRTGDLARWLPDGKLECLGRVDNQVKIRGFRIELGEVETVLSSHEAIRQCAVVVREDVPGEAVLVAYFESEAAVEPTAAGLRLHLKSQLPDYMVPSVFVRLDRLPFTPNGKINRKALPRPDHQTIETKREFIAPRDPLEQSLSRIWAQVLKRNRVGVNENFFDLGGHSLLAVRMMLELETLLGKRLPLATLLQAPTIETLADVLRRDNWRPSWSSLVPIRPGGSNPPLFLMHGHGGNVLEYYPLAELLQPDQPVYALQAQGLDGHIVKGRSIEEIAAGYLREIRTLQPEGPYFLGGFCFGGVVALEAAQQLCAAGEEVGLLVLIQTVNPEVNRFKASTGMVQRWWYRITKRLDLERENLGHRGPSYIGARLRKTWDFGAARAGLGLRRMARRADERISSMAQILEALGVEHDKAYDKYRSKRYAGNVVIFRATHQLRGLKADQSLGWKDYLAGEWRVVDVPGHQQNMMVEPSVNTLAEELGASLAIAQQRHGLVTA